MKIPRTYSRIVRSKGRKLRNSLGLYEYAKPTEEQKNVLARDVAKCLQVVNRVLNCSDQEFKSRAFLYSQLTSFGISRLAGSWPAMAKFSEYANGSELGTLQYLSEFIDYLMDCARHSPEKVVEIGVYHGGSAYFAAAVFQRANPKMRYSMIDIEDNLIAFEEFCQLLNLDRRVPSTAADYKKEEFDLVFIDADHSYDGAYGDFHALGKYARKFVAFHDIHGHEYDGKGGGIVRFWNEMRDEYSTSARIVEYAHSPGRWMGIGVIEKP